MEIFDFAMKMEKDGEAYYRSMAAQTGNAALKNVLMDLAEDEVKHFKIFQMLKEGDSSGVGKMQSSGTKVLNRAKNVFQQIAAKKAKMNFTSDVISAWKEAQKIEKKSEDFYRDKAKTADSKTQGILYLIADEEHKHWALIENVIQFLERPQQWLENAEWNHLDQY